MFDSESLSNNRIYIIFDNKVNIRLLNNNLNPFLERSESF